MSARRSRPGVLRQRPVRVLPGEPGGVLGAVLQLHARRAPRARAATRSTPAGVGRAAARARRRPRGAGGRARRRRRRSPAGRAPPGRSRRSARSTSSPTNRELNDSALHDDVDAVAQRVDHLERPAAGVVVRGEVPGRRARLVDLVEDLDVAVREHRQQRRLRARRDAVVLVDDLHAAPEPGPPGDVDVARGSSRRPGRSGSGVPNMSWTVSCGWPCCIARRTSVHRVAREHAHEHGARRLAAARSADEQAAAAHGEREQRQQDEATSTTGRWAGRPRPWSRPAGSACAGGPGRGTRRRSAG